MGSFGLNGANAALDNVLVRLIMNACVARWYNNKGDHLKKFVRLRPRMCAVRGSENKRML